MCHSSKSQCCVLTGDSASGKTESLRHILGYIASVVVLMQASLTSKFLQVQWRTIVRNSQWCDLCIILLRCHKKHFLDITILMSTIVMYHANFNTFTQESKESGFFMVIKHFIKDWTMAKWLRMLLLLAKSEGKQPHVTGAVSKQTYFSSDLCIW